jgi:HK97 family phage portal protein
MKLPRFFSFFAENTSNISDASTSGSVGIISDPIQKRQGDARVLPEHQYAGWVALCAQKIGESVGEIDFTLYRQKGDDVEDVADHDIVSLLYRPSQTLSQSMFFNAVAQSIVLWGSAPIRIVEMPGGYKLKDGRVIGALEMLRADKLRANVVSGVLIDYTYNGTQRIKKDAIINIRKPDPMDTNKGAGILNYGAIEINLDNKAIATNEDFWENNAEPLGVLESETSMSDKAIDRLRAMWLQRHSGAGHRGSPAVLDNGLKWKATAQTGDKLYTDTRAFQRDVIMTLMGVPKSLIVPEDANKASSVTAERVFQKYTVRPLMTTITDQLNEFLVPLFKDNEMLWLDYKKSNYVDEVEQDKMIAGSVNSYRTLNEVRRHFGLPDVEGGDVINQQTAGSTFDDADAKKNIIKKIATKNYTARKLENATNHSLDMSMRGRKNIIVLKKKSEKVMTPEMTAERKAYVANIEKRTKTVTRKLERLFAGEKRRVLAIFDGKKAFGDSNFWEQLDAEKEITKKELGDEMTDIYRADIGNGRQSILALVGLRETDLVETPTTLAFIRQMSQVFAERVSDTTYNALKETITEGLAGGEEPAQIRERVEGVMDIAQGFRSETIARTEVGRGQNYGRMEELARQGIGKKMWVSIFSNTRDAHAGAHGQIADLNGYFLVGGERCQYPMDSTLSAGNSINCQCSVSPVLD